MKCLLFNIHPHICLLKNSHIYTMLVPFGFFIFFVLYVHTYTYMMSEIYTHMTLEYVADKKKLIFLCQKHACQEGTQEEVTNKKKTGGWKILSFFFQLLFISNRPSKKINIKMYKIKMKEKIYIIYFSWWKWLHFHNHTRGKRKKTSKRKRKDEKQQNSDEIKFMRF